MSDGGTKQMSEVLSFGDHRACRGELTGGKGANLARMTQAGLPVPPGFCVTAKAYVETIAANALGDRIAEITDGLDYGDPAKLELRTAEIRKLIAAVEIPKSIVADVEASYGKLGADVLVAVRSSGTAEDLEDTSFAGQHDTYLHIKGADGVVDALKRCWASMWTARAVAYRHGQGFDHRKCEMAVVIQQMVSADVSGVMFTGNPITTATDEFVVNASWGLGEAIVSGIVVPDEFTIDGETLRVKRKVCGSKQVRIVLDSASGAGTVTEDVPAADQERFSLPDSQVSALASVGRDVMDYYGGLPQDIEWAFADDQLFLLQSRPITGVEFSWDIDLDAGHNAAPAKPEDDDILWTRSWSDEFWTGAITPLFYSHRANCYTEAFGFVHATLGLTESAGARHWRFYKSEAYFNSTAERVYRERMFPPQFRAGLLDHVGGPDEQAAALVAPFDWTKWVRGMARISLLEPAHGPFKWQKVFWNYIYNRREEATGLSDEAIHNLSDRRLVEYAKASMAYEVQYFTEAWMGFLFWAHTIASALGYMLVNWYSGGNEHVMTDLLTGSIRPTATVVENLRLWQLATEIRESEELLALFRSTRDGEFFTRLEQSQAGRDFRANYDQFLAESGHRGHADRDIYFSRRLEDPAVDYRSLESMLNADANLDPEERDEAANARRRAATDEVLANLRQQPMGFLKVEAFKVANSYIQEVVVLRDDERNFLDLITFRIKRVFLEINRRLVSRGLLDSGRDFYFLGKEELFELFLSGRQTPLLKAKVAARMRNFDRVDRRDESRPHFLRDYRPVVTQQEVTDDSSGVLTGMGTSRGEIVGRARIVPSLMEIGRVQQGDILIVNATDPGWTPVFLLISGLVLETGGVLAHGSCLSREYGIPAVQLANAMQRIPDGALIKVNGELGQVTILEVAEAAAEEDAVAALG